LFCNKSSHVVITGPFLPAVGEEEEEQLEVEAMLPSSNSKNASPIPSPCPIIMALGQERLLSGKERGDLIRYVL
jgi:predicted secreted protein